jgi:hypothetical protein
VISKFKSSVELPLYTAHDDLTHDFWVRLVTHLENSVRVDFAEPIEGGLKIVYGLPHISLSSEN